MITPSPTPALSTFGVVQLPPLPPRRALTLVPANDVIQAPSDAEIAQQLLFFSRPSGRITALETPRMTAPAWGWLQGGTALANTSSGLVLYDPNSNTAHRLELRDEVWSLLVAKTPRAAIQLKTLQTAVLDLNTWQFQPIALNARPLAWSPDGLRLLVQVERSGQAVLMLDQTLPGLYTLPVGLGTGYTGWLSNTSLMAIHTAGSFPAPVGQVVDISGASPVVTPIPGIVGTSSVSFSPDASRVAIGGTAPVGVKVFETQGMRQVADFPGMRLGFTLDVSTSIWTADSRRIALIAGLCTPDERIVMAEVAGGKQTDVVKAGPYQLALAPDASQLAYTTGRQIFVVPVDVPAAPREVFAQVWAPAPISWSPDGRTLGFLHFAGGYGRCG